MPLKEWRSRGGLCSPGPRPSAASLSAHSPSRSQITVMGLLRRRRALYLLLAADGGVRERPYLDPPCGDEYEGEHGDDEYGSVLHSSGAALLAPPPTPPTGEWAGL